jgi:hypothetical protein
MPSRVVVVIDGVTFVQVITPAARERDLQAACNYLLRLINQEQAKQTGGPHG